MKITVRLFATLRRYLPPGSDGTKVVLELPDGARLQDALDQLSIPAPLAQLVMIDGVHETNRQRVLHDGIALSIFPPVAGGVAIEGEYRGSPEHTRSSDLARSSIL
jgi:molybdopterin converting factor small subunit